MQWFLFERFAGVLNPRRRNCLFLFGTVPKSLRTSSPRAMVGNREWMECFAGT